MEIVFTEDEIRACLPPPGRYRVTAESFAASSADSRPAQVRIVWAVTDRPAPALIFDAFVLRGRPSVAHPGMRRLLALLDIAGITVRAGHPVDLRRLIGFECFIDVERGLDPSGFPHSRVARYQPLARPSAPRATTSRDRNGAGTRSSSATASGTRPDQQRDSSASAPSQHDGGARGRDATRRKP